MISKRKIVRRMALSHSPFNMLAMAAYRLRKKMSGLRQECFKCVQEDTVYGKLNTLKLFDVMITMQLYVRYIKSPIFHMA